MSRRINMNYENLASQNTVNKTAAALKEKGYRVYSVNKAAEALKKIREIIPEGSSVMNGSSVTLEQIGYIDYLKSEKHPFNDLHKKVTVENDPDRRSKLRKEAALSEFYLGSVHALTENGDFIVASNTGSQLPHIVYTSKNLIFVVSVKKIVSDISSGMKRLEEHVFPLEIKHMKELYNIETNISKIVIFKKEHPLLKRKIHFILVNENLGF